MMSFLLQKEVATLLGDDHPGNLVISGSGYNLLRFQVHLHLVGTAVNDLLGVGITCRPFLGRSDAYRVGLGFRDWVDQ